MSYLVPFLHGGLSQLLWTVFGFLVVLTVLVFVHELGHYLIARRIGVRIEVFSIGFGPELFGWHDRAGTRWKFSVIPLGGYVKMFGDSDPASVLPTAQAVEFTEAERAVSFHHKRLAQRIAVVSGGPLANFVFAIVVLAMLFMTHGQPFTPPEVGQVQAGSAAEEAGVRPGDRVQSIDGQPIERFEDMQQAVRLNNPGVPMDVVVRRAGELITLRVTPAPLLGIGRGAPDVAEVQAASAAERGGIKPGDRITSIAGQKIERFEDVQLALRLKPPDTPIEVVVQRAGKPVTLSVKVPAPVLGIGHIGVEFIKRDPASAALRAVTETWNLSSATLKAMWQMVIGTRPADELGGPLRIAQMSGEVAQSGFVAMLWFMAVLSINLGLINLFPVPVLDGGHLLFYAAEAIRGKPLGQRAQEYGFRIGLALVMTLMVFATWNDLVRFWK